MNYKNSLNPRKLKQLKRSGYLEKIKPSISKDEEILDIHLKIDALTRIMGYVFIPMSTIILFILILLLEIYFGLPYINFTWPSLELIIGTIIYVYFIFFAKNGYEIKIIVFTDKGIYFFNSLRKEVEKMIYDKDAKDVYFYRDTYYKKFYLGIGVRNLFKLTKESLKFIYFILYNYCTPEVQIKNKLIAKGIHYIENEFQHVNQQSEFKISTKIYNDITKKRKGLLIKYMLYEVITLVVIIFAVIFINTLVPYLGWGIILIYIGVILLGVMTLFLIPQTGYEIYQSLKKISYLPDSTFKLLDDGIKATSSSGDNVWIPFEEDLIIGMYDGIENTWVSTDSYNWDSIDLYKINGKKNSKQVGPVEEPEFFGLIALRHYLNWLNRNGLIPSMEFVKNHYLLSDPVKNLIKEKILLKDY